VYFVSYRDSDHGVALAALVRHHLLAISHPVILSCFEISMVTNLQPWFKSPRVSIFDKSNLLRITIYGLYSGNYTNRLEHIASSLRKEFSDSYLVKDRGGFRNQHSNESNDEYFTNKSYYYLEHSHVNIFVLYCRAHGEGVVGIRILDCLT
jgi:hypothetical protein